MEGSSASAEPMVVETIEDSASAADAEGKARDIWPSRTSFVLAAMGSAVGLGNVWRFPYYCYKYGGGAFLIPYFIALITTGIPLMVLEYNIGIKYRTSAPLAYARINKKSGWVGWFALLMGAIVIMYYMVILAWSLMYMAMAPNQGWGDEPNDFFINDFIGVTEGPGTIGGFNLSIIVALAVMWVMVFLIIHKGTEVVSKVVLVTVPLPFILLIIMAVRGFYLEGSADGLNYYLEPNYDKMWTADVWLAAYGQIFFTLSLATGVMIAYSSYLPTRSDAANNAHIVSLMNAGTSLIAGLAVFSVLGYLAYTQSAPIESVASESGTGLAFIVYPTAINTMGDYAVIFGLLFFFTLITLGIDSAFAFVETLVQGFKDIGVSPRTALYGCCGLMFAGGLIFTSGGGFHWLDIIDHFLNNFGLIGVGVLECIIIGHLYGAERMAEDSNSISELNVGRKWIYSIKYVTPIILGVIILVKLLELTDGYGGYPDWALAVGFIFIPITLLISYYIQRRYME